MGTGERAGRGSRQPGQRRAPPFAPASGHTDDTLQFAVVAGIGTALHIVIAQQRNSFHATLDATGAVSAWG